MSKLMTTCKDFDTSHLSGDAIKIANVIKLIMGEGASGGGCKAFYTPKQWAERGESYGQQSALIVVHDGGDLAPYCNYNYECYRLIEKMDAALKEIGYYLESCTCWYSAVYKI